MVDRDRDVPDDAPPGDICCSYRVVGGVDIDNGGAGPEGRYVERVFITSLEAATTVTIDGFVAAQLEIGGSVELDVPSRNQQTVGCGTGSLHAAWMISSYYSR